MFKLAAFVVLALLPFVTAQAELSITSPISVSTEVPSWNSEVASKISNLPADETGYTECRQTLEVPGAYLCVSATQVAMNQSLTRASMFIEGFGAGGKGIIARLDSQDYRSGVRMIGGHDLRAADLLRFYDAMNSECEATKDPQICPNIFEKQIFEKLILPKAARDSKFVVITYAIRSSMSYQDVVTHEILHAQYFNDEKFRAVADDFWANELTEQVREEIRSSLSRYYDRTDELLMKNEFQAYMLMAGADQSQLAYLVPQYREALTAKLKAVGVSPIQVQ